MSEINGNGKYKVSIEHRLTTVEHCYRELNKDIVEIRDNHLVHLAVKVDKIQGVLSRVTWLLITTLLAAVINLGFLFLTR